jgi:hypothetical protein
MSCCWEKIIHLSRCIFFRIKESYDYSTRVEDSFFFLKQKTLRHTRNKKRKKKGHQERNFPRFFSSKNLDGTLVCPILFAAAAPKWLLNPSSQSPRRRLAFPSASSPRQLHLPAASPCCPRHSCPKGAAFPPLPYPPAGVAGRRPRSSARAGMTRRPP